MGDLIRRHSNLFVRLFQASTHSKSYNNSSTFRSCVSNNGKNQFPVPDEVQSLNHDPFPLAIFFLLTKEQVGVCHSLQAAAHIALLIVNNSKSVCKSCCIRLIGMSDAPPFRRPPAALVLTPNEEQFADPTLFVESIREEGEKYGIVKIVPPKVKKRKRHSGCDGFWN